jgi:hypothetical protein
MMVSAYSLISFIGYIFFYLGTFLALPAIFKGCPPTKPNTAATKDKKFAPNLLWLGIGISIFTVGGILQVLAEFFWGFVFTF